MADGRFEIRFRDCTPDEANDYAADLEAELDGVDAEVNVSRQKDQQDAQDFGATLVLILGTGAITALAKGLSTWIARNSGARVVITKDGKVVAENLNSEDAARVVASVFKT